MDESTMDAEVRTLRIAEAGVLMTMVTSSANLTEKAIGASFDVLKSLRGELFRATNAGIDWIEGMQQSSFRVAREVVIRVDKLSQETVEGLESVAMSVSRAIRGSGEAASEMVSRTAESLVGKRASSAKAA